MSVAFEVAQLTSQYDKLKQKIEPFLTGYANNPEKTLDTYTHAHEYPSIHKNLKDTIVLRMKCAELLVDLADEGHAVYLAKLEAALKALETAREERLKGVEVKVKAKEAQDKAKEAHTSQAGQEYANKYPAYPMDAPIPKGKKATTPPKKATASSAKPAPWAHLTNNTNAKK